jgi:acetylornithine deacetylase/succinyl-diaminopimelate desuccinylase-like protein
VEDALPDAGVNSFVVHMPEYMRPAWTGTQNHQELYYPTWKIPEDHVLVRSGVKAFSELYGKAPKVDKWTFSTNGVAICGRHQIPVIGFGPGDEVQAHAPNEINRIDDLEIASSFYAALPYMMETLGA